MLKRIADQVGIEVKFEIVNRGYLPRPTTPGERLKEQFGAPLVALACFKYLAINNLLDRDAIQELLNAGPKLLHTANGAPLRRYYVGQPVETFMSGGMVRYKLNHPLNFFGDTYVITGQWFARSIDTLLDWLRNHGIPIDEHSLGQLAAEFRSGGQIELGI